MTFLPILSQDNIKEPTQEEIQAAIDAGDIYAIYMLWQSYIRYNFRNSNNAYELASIMKKYDEGLGLFMIGECHLYGKGTEINPEKANDYYKKAAYKDNVNAMLQLSQNYREGIGCIQNNVKSFDWLNQAYQLITSSNGYKHSRFCDLKYVSYLLGYYYQFAIGVKKDVAKAVELYKDGGDYGIMQLAGMYLTGKDVDKDVEEGFRLINQIAQTGNQNAQATLASLYFEGRGIPKNHLSAKKWAERSIQGSAGIVGNRVFNRLGHSILACIYAKGPSKNTDKALEYINKAIENEEYLDNISDKESLALISLYDTKGYIYLCDGQYDKAREMAHKIELVNPDYDNQSGNELMNFYYGRTNNENMANRDDKKLPESDVDQDLPVSDRILGRTFAVIIGNEHYEEVCNVDFANNDANSFANYCKRIWGIPESNIRMYQDATYGKMIGALDDIEAIAKAYNGDLNIIFYYAGHGLPNEKDYTSHLLPVDGSGRTTNLCVPLSKLYDRLEKTNANKITVFLDACFSGSVRGEGMITAARGIAIKAQPEESRKNMVIFSAASDDETALPLTEQGHGLFTYYLLKKLKMHNGSVALSDLSEYVIDNVKKQSIVINRKPQTPTFMGDVDLSSNWFGE